MKALSTPMLRETKSSVYSLVQFRVSSSIMVGFPAKESPSTLQAQGIEFPFPSRVNGKGLRMH
jgi:hypothetical protein